MITYTAGGLEDAAIRKAVCEILEGGEAAFANGRAASASGSSDEDAMTDQPPPSGENHADLPIERPGQDLYGIDPFVGSLTRSVRGMKSPQGIVIGLNGPWGSGKSSAINLLRHHLAEAVENEDVEDVTFNPWWFRGEEALALAF